VQKRGQTRGPSFPLLFVQGANLLQYLVDFSYKNGLLTPPIPIRAEFPIIYYAHDTIIVLPAKEEQLSILRKY
jgi:hypothetical protein